LHLFLLLYVYSENSSLILRKSITKYEYISLSATGVTFVAAPQSALFILPGLNVQVTLLRKKNEAAAAAANLALSKS